MNETPWVLIERVAAAMYGLPDPSEPDYEPKPWPPTHPDDHAWWMAHAKAAINAINAANCTAWYHGQPGCICRPIEEF